MLRRLPCQFWEVVHFGASAIPKFARSLGEAKKEFTILLFVVALLVAKIFKFGENA